MVDEGEKIAVYHRAQPGKKGKNIYGEAIHGEHGLEKPPLRGMGFRITPNGTYFSKMNGKFEYTAGCILITNMLVVREDVTAVTGKLEVDGSVHVIGSIYSGGYIKATGDIIIEQNVDAYNLGNRLHLKTLLDIGRNELYGIEVQGRRLAELDAEVSKLVNFTEQLKGAVCVKGTAYEGGIIVLNGIKFLLTTKVRRVHFKLRNKRVVMVFV